MYSIPKMSLVVALTASLCGLGSAQGPPPDPTDSLHPACVHKKTISYCIKAAAGEIVKEGTLAAERCVLRNWAGSLQEPWHGAMEATIFSAWVMIKIEPLCATLKRCSSLLKQGAPTKLVEERIARF